MPSDSDARKKAKELDQLGVFKGLFGGFPTGDVFKSENPDFLVRAEERCIGIEITELHREASENTAQTPRAQSAIKEAVLRQAKHLCEEQQLGLFHVYVNFHPGLEVTGARQRGLVGELAQRIKSYLPGYGQSVIVSRSPRTLLSDEIISISIDQVPFDGEDKSYVIHGLSGSYDLYNVEDIQMVLNRKEARVPDYRKQCSEVWLLVGLSTRQLGSSLTLRQKLIPSTRNLIKLFICTCIEVKSQSLRLVNPEGTQIFFGTL